MARVRLVLGSVSVGRSPVETRRVPSNINRKMHWAKKLRWDRAWKEEVFYAVAQQRGKLGKLPLAGVPKVSVQLFQTKLMDYDNLHSSAKVIIDALKVGGGCGVIADDGPNDISVSVSQEQVNRRDDEHVEVELSFSV